MISATEGIRRYGLKLNPYGIPRLNVRDPKERLRTAQIHRIDSFALREHFRAATKGPFVLVTGPDGSGRRVVADRCVSLFQRWKGFRKTPPPKFAYVAYDPGSNNSAEQVTMNVLELLRGATTDLGVTFATGPATILGSALVTQSPVAYNVRLASVMQSYAKAMELAGASYGLVVENAATLEILNSTLQVFATKAGIVVVRLADYGRAALIKPFLEKAGDQAREIPLQTLKGAIVSRLADHRWQKWRGRNPFPFDPTGLCTTFDNDPRTVGRTLELLKEMLKFQVTAAGPGPLWGPGVAGLDFDRALIQRLFDYLEKR